jgi:hypothetical protein
MEDPATTTLSQEETPRETLGRRQLLKAIAATGGAVAASTLLPGEWAKPVVEVGVLPAHAQISLTPEPQPEPLAYSAVCDTNPGGGDVSIPAFNGTISQIKPFIVVTSGSGPVNGIPVTLSIEMTSQGTPPPPPPTFVNASQSTTTTTTADGPGRAQFQDVSVVAGGQIGQAFFLIFDFVTPVGTIQARCGEFTWGPPGPD